MKREGKRDRKERKKGKLSEKRERGKSVRFSLFISLTCKRTGILKTICK